MATPADDDSVPRPLSGVRVLELAQNLAGPYCAQILADLGAAVVKVERPGGDAARAWGPPFIDGVGSIFGAANRGKRSVTLDLQDPADAAVLRGLIARCDILIEAFRPGAFARQGFDFEAACALNPRLIYCSVLAYGEHGPLSHLPGYDPLMQAHGGLMSVTGPGPGTPVRVGTSVVDMGTGMWLAIGVLAALRERDARGQPQRLSVSLYDTTLAFNAYHLSGCAATGVVPGPMGSELPMIAPYGAFPAADGEIMIAAANDGLFVKLCRALGLDDVAADPAFAANPDRVAGRVRLNAMLAARTSGYPCEALLKLLRGAGVPCAPIQDMRQVLADPQTEAAAMIGDSASGYATSLPLRWSGSRPPAGGTVPAAGEHTAEVRAEVERSGG